MGGFITKGSTSTTAPASTSKVSGRFRVESHEERISFPCVVVPLHSWQHGEWQPHHASSIVPPSTPSSLSILTLNVWFDDYKRETRNKEIVNIINKEQPTVVCLQEVKDDFLATLLADERVQERYLTSHVKVDDYETIMLLSLHDCHAPQLIEAHITTAMSRKLLLASFVHAGGRVDVATCHLESLMFADIRERQLREYVALLRHLHPASSSCLEERGSLSVLCGDFNFCSYRNWEESESSSWEELENNMLSRRLPTFVDVWPALWGEQPRRQSPPSDEMERLRMGYTFDTDRNPNIRAARPSHRDEMMRYDRILARTTSWRPLSIRLVANQPCSAPAELPDEEEEDSTPKELVYPSDHFGLLACFEPTSLSLH